MLSANHSYSRRSNIDRRGGNGRRCSLGDRIASIPCQASCYAPGRLEEQDKIILFFKSSWCKIASTARTWSNSVPQAAATTFAFSSVYILDLYVDHYSDLVLGGGVVGVDGGGRHPPLVPLHLLVQLNTANQPLLKWPSQDIFRLENYRPYLTVAPRPPTEAW